MESPGGHPPACLASSDGWALHQEHILGCPGGWGGGPENCSPDLDFFLAGKMASKHSRATNAAFGVATLFPGQIKYKNTVGKLSMCHLARNVRIQPAVIRMEPGRALWSPSHVSTSFPASFIDANARVH
eukprot:15659-Pelagomonas_calceolata.AAC.1